MLNNRKVKLTASTTPTAIGIGVLISLLVTVIGVAVTAYLTTTEMISENTVGVATAIILIVSSALGTMIGAIRVQQRRMMTNILTGLCYFLCLLAMTALFFGGQYNGIGKTILCVLLGNGFAVMAGTASGKKQKIRKRKYPYR